MHCYGNNIPGFCENSTPLWLRGQDALLIILGLPDGATLHAIVWSPPATFTVVTFWLHVLSSISPVWKFWDDCKQFHARWLDLNLNLDSCEIRECYCHNSVFFWKNAHSFQKNAKECNFLLGFTSHKKFKKKTLSSLKDCKRMLHAECKRTQCPTLRKMTPIKYQQNLSNDTKNSF